MQLNPCSRLAVNYDRRCQHLGTAAFIVLPVWTPVFAIASFPSSSNAPDHDSGDTSAIVVGASVGVVAECLLLFAMIVLRRWRSRKQPLLSPEPITK